MFYPSFITNKTERFSFESGCVLQVENDKMHRKLQPNKTKVSVTYMVITCMYDAVVIKIILESPHGVRSCCKATSYRSVANSKSFTMNLCKRPILCR